MNRSDENRRRVLVVDDDRDIRDNLSDILTDVGFEVYTAADAAAALEITGGRRVDVALVDLKMPGEDGLSLARKLKTSGSGVVPIIVTGYSGGATPEEFADAGAWRVLNKPIHPPSLLALVAEAAEQPLVLVVDDDRTLCHNLWDILRERGYRVGMTHDGRDLEAWAGRTRPSVALVDLRLPDCDGVEALRRLKAAHPDLKVVVVTGYPTELGGLVEQARNEGAEDVRVKPFDVASLLELMDSLTS